MIIFLIYTGSKILLLETGHRFIDGGSDVANKVNWARLNQENLL